MNDEPPRLVVRSFSLADTCNDNDEPRRLVGCSFLLANTHNDERRV
jgi:hypothetical protein